RKRIDDPTWQHALHDERAPLGIERELDARPAGRLDDDLDVAVLVVRCELVEAHDGRPPRPSGALVTGWAAPPSAAGIGGRAGRAALGWPEEAAAIAGAGRSLTELRAVGPWLARIVGDWLAHPPAVSEPPPIRRTFLTRTEVDATLAGGGAPALRGDLQMH